MGWLSVFTITAFLLTLAGYPLYIQSLFKGGARPTISSWIAWWITDVVVFAGMVAADAIVWQMVAYSLGIGATIFVCVRKKAALGWTWLDTLCLCIVGVALVLWSFSNTPETAIILSLVAETIGTIPMFRNVWRKPESEPFLPWAIWWVGGCVGVLAIPEWSIAGAVAPILFCVLQTLVVVLIARKFGPIGRERMINGLFLTLFFILASWDWSRLWSAKSRDQPLPR